MKMITLTVSMLCCLVILGCASGRYPDPVLSYQPDDVCMTCDELRVEMAKAKQAIIIKQTNIKERDNRNNELFGVGLLLWYPWGEMDVLRAEEWETKALISRYNNLFTIAANKRCFLGNNTIAVKKKGGRDVTVDDVLDDELPSSVQPLAALNQ